MNENKLCKQFILKIEVILKIFLSMLVLFIFRSKILARTVTVKGSENVGHFPDIREKLEYFDVRFVDINLYLSAYSFH